MLERAVRGWSLNHRLPADFDRIRLRTSPDSLGLKVLIHSSEVVAKDLFAAVRTLVRPGDTVYDIGANVGYFGVAAAVKAGHTGRVICFEPDQFNLGLIRTTARRLNPATHARLDALPMAVADGGARFAEFAIAERARASNSLASVGRTQAGGTRATLVVPTTTVDEVADALAPPRVIKIDVEGAETMVLAGATGVLDNHRPALVIEVGKEYAGDITQALLPRDYRLFNGDRPQPFESPVDSAVWNTWAIPAERLEELAPRASHPA
ncbi:MAG: FkbM family methyltransferase [Planctomycetota bacterium]